MTTQLKIIAIELVGVDDSVAKLPMLSEVSTRLGLNMIDSGLPRHKQ